MVSRFADPFKYPVPQKGKKQGHVLRGVNLLVNKSIVYTHVSGFINIYSSNFILTYKKIYWKTLTRNSKKTGQN